MTLVPLEIAISHAGLFRLGATPSGLTGRAGSEAPARLEDREDHTEIQQSARDGRGDDELQALAAGQAMGASK